MDLQEDRVCAPHARRPSGSAPSGVRALAADATDSGSIRRALEGVDVAYYLVHSLGSRNFSDLDRRAAANIAHEAERAGVSQIVYLGGLGDDRPDLSPHLRSRIETATALSARAVPVTTLRAAVVIGRGSAGFETIVSFVDRLLAMIAPKWISTPTQPIALADVVQYLGGVAGHPDTLGQIFDIGGPEVVGRLLLERSSGGLVEWGERPPVAEGSQDLADLCP